MKSNTVMAIVINIIVALVLTISLIMLNKSLMSSRQENIKNIKSEKYNYTETNVACDLLYSAKEYYCKEEDIDLLTMNPFKDYEHIWKIKCKCV